MSRRQSEQGRGGFKRYLEDPIAGDALADGKMAFVSGPRQVGKTTMARHFLKSAHNDFTWDDERFRRRWVRDPVGAMEDRGDGPVLLDEIHKDRRWKNRLKGLWDVQEAELQVIVTGSARLDTYRKGGDSLAGRYIPYRLHPVSIGEHEEPPGPDDIEDGVGQVAEVYPYEDLLALGGFPEPLLAGNRAKAARWSRLRREQIVAQDVRDLRNVQDLHAMRVLVDLLPERVGSLLSMNSLREDVGVAYATVRDWIAVLESLYHLFRIRPLAANIRRAVKAEPKMYLFDLLPVTSDGARRENLTALHLLKACHFWTDTAQGEFDLRFVRTKDGREVDFVVLRDRSPWMLVECKSRETNPSTGLDWAVRQLGTHLNYQLVDRPGHDRLFAPKTIRVVDYRRFLASLP